MVIITSNVSHSRVNGPQALGVHSSHELWGLTVTIPAYSVSNNLYSQDAARLKAKFLLPLYRIYEVAGGWRLTRVVRIEMRRIHKFKLGMSSSFQRIASYHHLALAQPRFLYESMLSILLVACSATPFGYHGSHTLSATGILSSLCGGFSKVLSTVEGSAILFLFYRSPIHFILSTFRWILVNISRSFLLVILVAVPQCSVTTLFDFNDLS